MRGDVYRLRAPRRARAHEQRGERYAVALQSDDLPLSTLLVAPTSRSAPPRIFRPTIIVQGVRTQVLVEQTAAVAAERLGDVVGHLTRAELEDVSDALRLALELD